jgi:hypothetical protein
MTATTIAATTKVATITSIQINGTAGPGIGFGLAVGLAVGLGVGVGLGLGVGCTTELVLTVK